MALRDLSLIKEGVGLVRLIPFVSYLYLHCLQEPNQRVSIVRKTLPALRNTVMVDFLEIIQGMGIYRKDSHNKTNNTYTFPNGSQVAFFSTDDEQKLRGRKHSIVWANEANELLNDEFMQLNMRCEGQVFCRL